MRVAAIVFTGVSSAVALLGQAEMPSFDVVSIKRTAWSRQYRRSQIIGAPSWLDSDHYDITAKAITASDMSDNLRPSLLDINNP